MVSIKRIAALMFLFVPLLATAQLKGHERIVAQVPFKFMVGDVTVPAGQISVQLANEKVGVLSVENRDAGQSVFAFTAFSEAKANANAPEFVFRRYGDNWFLAGLKIDGSRTVYEFRESKLEKELRAQNLPASEEVLLASAR